MESMLIRCHDLPDRARESLFRDDVEKLDINVVPVSSQTVLERNMACCSTVQQQKRLPPGSPEIKRKMTNIPTRMVRNIMMRKQANMLTCKTKEQASFDERVLHEPVSSKNNPVDYRKKKLVLHSTSVSVYWQAFMIL